MVVMSWPRHEITARIIELPSQDPDELVGMIRLGCEEYVPYPADELIIGGNSSLNLMFDTVAQCMTHGPCAPGAAGKPWFGQGVSFLCPVPGYDRHFAITEHFGIRMIPVPMDDHGPVMDRVEEIAGSDPSVRGMWCVPKYSNPSGAVYSEEVVRPP